MGPRSAGVLKSIESILIKTCKQNQGRKEKNTNIGYSVSMKMLEKKKFDKSLLDVLVSSEDVTTDQGSKLSKLSVS